MTKRISCRFDLRFPPGVTTAERVKVSNEVAETAFRGASLAGERLSPNRVHWIERLPPYDTPEFDALSSAPPLAQESVARNTAGRMTEHNQIDAFLRGRTSPPAPPAPPAAATLACLTLLLEHPDSLQTILLVAETRGGGAGKVALELARQMAAAGIVPA